MKQKLEKMVQDVRALILYPEVDAETDLAEWIESGNWQSMTLQSIAAEWDDLSAQALGE